MNDIVNHKWTDQEKDIAANISKVADALVSAVHAIGEGRKIKDTHPTETHLLTKAKEHIALANMYAIQALIVGPRTDEYWGGMGIDVKYLAEIA